MIPLRMGFMQSRFKFSLAVFAVRLRRAIAEHIDFSSSCGISRISMDTTVGEGPSETSRALIRAFGTASSRQRRHCDKSSYAPREIFCAALRSGDLRAQYTPENHVKTLPQFVNQVRNFHAQSVPSPDSSSFFSSSYSSLRGLMRRSPAPGSLALRIIFALSLTLLCRTQLPAAVHPVPLEPKTDSAKCLECHEDKSKGKAVHSAIAMGCLSCHEIRVNKDTTRVKLITATPYKLCLTCHADKDASQIKGRVHPPAVRDCLTCHDPHSSDNKNQLLKATAGEKKDNLCLTCHTQGTNVPAGGSRHAALDMGCDTCHVTHKTGAEPTAENRFHLTKAAPALCVDCHDPKDADLQKAHQNQPFGTADCLQCHDPHQSAQPKLMAKFMHPPFAEKQCDTCHAPAKDGKVVLTQANGKDFALPATPTRPS